jgi:hypothetical protein
MLGFVRLDLVGLVHVKLIVFCEREVLLRRCFGIGDLLLRRRFVMETFC